MPFEWGRHGQLTNSCGAVAKLEECLELPIPRSNRKTRRGTCIDVPHKAQDSILLKRAWIFTWNSSDDRLECYMTLRDCPVLCAFRMRTLTIEFSELMQPFANI